MSSKVIVVSQDAAGVLPAKARSARTDTAAAAECCVNCDSSVAPTRFQGMPSCRVCYRWATTSLPCLTCGDVPASYRLRLNADGHCGECVQPCSKCRAPFAKSLLAKKGKFVFCEPCEAEVLCQICGDEVRHGDYARTGCNTHIFNFCKPCVKQYTSIKIKDAFSTINIRCPGEKCPHVLDSRSVKFFAGRDFEKYEKLMAQTHSQRLNEILSKNDKETKAFAEYLRQTARYCPKCFVVIERNEGCNELVCSCGYIFCYGCGGPYEVCHGSCSQFTEDNARRLQPVMVGAKPLDVKKVVKPAADPLWAPAPTTQVVPARPALRVIRESPRCPTCGAEDHTACPAKTSQRANRRR